MVLVPAIMTALLLQAPCDGAKRKQGELAAEAAPWFSRHTKDCTLCADGSSCRDGYERRASMKRVYETWRAGHAAGGCAVCAAAGVAGRCGAVENQKQLLTADAQVRHKTKDARCEFDAGHCEGWRAAEEELKRSLEAWKKDHLGLCDRCAPDCEDWRKKAKETALRSEEALGRHRERCGDCKAGGCDRAAVMREDAARQRQTAWRSHSESCGCAKKR